MTITPVNCPKHHRSTCACPSQVAAQQSARPARQV